jgi:hypothetical protein
VRNTHLHYVISDERLRAYAQVPLIERLRWLEELVRFTQMWRAAPRVEAGGSTPSPGTDATDR